MSEITINYDLGKKFFGAEPLFNKQHFGDVITLSIDSRITSKNSIFFAIKGDYADGHDYIDQACANGAVLVVADLSNKQRMSTDAPILWVNNPLETFSELAHDYLQEMPAQKLALTGSNGKTTTKEMIKSALIGILGEKEVYASAGNKNNHFGVPLSAFAVKKEHRFALFEMGMNAKGEIAQLCTIVKPTLGLITNISTAHEGCFVDGIYGIQKAKGELFSALHEKGHAVINFDDDRIREESSYYNFLAHTTFGYAPKSTVRILNRSTYNFISRTQSIKVQVKEEILEIICPLPGAHQAYNVAATIAVIHALGLSTKDAAIGLGNMQLMPGRLDIKVSSIGALIINDGYNANPASMKAGIAASLEFKAQRRIAAIGAMAELGAKSAFFHDEIGTIVAQHFDYLFICGEEAYPIVTAALKMGFDKNHIVFAPSSLELIEPIKALARSGDIIFIKGSYSTHMAAIVDALGVS
jgi:UDP-N-acetylmuramoyl-tripeptide--D-alanyl-D-alanine ligase